MTHRTLQPSTPATGFPFLGLLGMIALLSLAAMLVTPPIVASAERRDAATPSGAPRMVPASVDFAAIGGVTVTLRQVDVDTKRFVFVVRGAEVTGFPQGLPMTFEFDTAVKPFTLTTASSGLRVAPHSTTHTVTCVLRRDPFTPPASWAYTVWVTLEDLPTTGRIVVGSVETHDVVYQMAPRSITALASSPAILIPPARVPGGLPDAY